MLYYIKTLLKTKNETTCINYCFYMLIKTFISQLKAFIYKLHYKSYIYVASDKNINSFYNKNNFQNFEFRTFKVLFYGFNDNTF